MQDKAAKRIGELLLAIETPVAVIIDVRVRAADYETHAQPINHGVSMDDNRVRHLGGFRTYGADVVGCRNLPLLLFCAVSDYVWRVVL
jgi:hypothetical protein